VARVSGVAAEGSLYAAPGLECGCGRGLFGVRAGTRGGIAARRGAARVRVLGAGGRGAGERARAAVALRCRGAGTSARGWQVTRGSGAAVREEKRKRRGGRLGLLSQSGRRGGGERAGAGLSRSERKKGKLTGGSRPSAAPGGKEAERHDGSRSWAGPACAGWRACGGGREKGKERLGSGSVGRWAGGPLGVLEVIDWI
jgi:hypothetical protein